MQEQFTSNTRLILPAISCVNGCRSQQCGYSAMALSKPSIIQGKHQHCSGLPRTKFAKGVSFSSSSSSSLPLACFCNMISKNDLKREKKRQLLSIKAF